MKIYGIAKEINKVHGHGDTGTEFSICRQGPYSSGEFPPFFKWKNEAEKWLKDNEIKYGKIIIVELNLHD